MKTKYTYSNPGRSRPPVELILIENSAENVGKT